MAREGISHYEKAIDGFQRLGLSLMVLSAKAYLSREVVRRGLPEGEKMVEALRSSVKNSQASAIKRVFKSAEDLLLARKMMSDKEEQLSGVNTGLH